MKRAKLIKRHEIAAQTQANEQRTAATAANATKQALATVRSWVKQRQTAQPSAYQAFAALFAEPGTKGAA